MSTEAPKVYRRQATVPAPTSTSLVSEEIFFISFGSPMHAVWIRRHESVPNSFQKISTRSTSSSLLDDEASPNTLTAGTTGQVIAPLPPDAQNRLAPATLQDALAQMHKGCWKMLDIHAVLVGIEKIAALDPARTVPQQQHLLLARQLSSLQKDDLGPDANELISPMSSQGQPAVMAVTLPERRPRWASISEADWPELDLIRTRRCAKGALGRASKKRLGLHGHRPFLPFSFAQHGGCGFDTKHFAKHCSHSKQKRPRRHGEFSLWAAPRWHLLRELLMDEDLNNTALGGFTVGKFQVGGLARRCITSRDWARSINLLGFPGDGMAVFRAIAKECCSEEQENQLRVGRPSEGDSWCVGCSALEASLLLFKKRWTLPGIRAVAEEAAVSSARETSRPERDHREQREHREREAPREPERKEASDSYTEESEEEEEQTVDEVKKEDDEKTTEQPKPPRESEPPTGERSEHREPPRSSRGSERPPEPPGKPRPKSGDHSVKRKRRKRGGARHQQHRREYYNPLRTSHRRLDSSHLELSRSLESGLRRRYCVRRWQFFAARWKLPLENRWMLSPLGRMETGKSTERS
eukprot:s38_g23.t1